MKPIAMINPRDARFNVVLQVEVASLNRTCGPIEKLCYIPGSNHLGVIQVRGEYVSVISLADWGISLSFINFHDAQLDLPSVRYERLLKLSFKASEGNDNSLALTDTPGSSKSCTSLAYGPIVSLPRPRKKGAQPNREHIQLSYLDKGGAA